MNCTDCKKSISEYSVGLVAGREKAEMDAHLDSCSGCKAELVKLDRVMGLVEILELREPPVGLWNGVFNSITATPERSDVRERVARLLHRTVTRWSVGVATAMLAVLLAFSYSHAPTQSDAGYGTAELVHGHIAYSSQDVLSDQVALNSLAALASREQSSADSL